MKRTLALLLLTVMLASSLLSCSKKNKGENGNDTSVPCEIDVDISYECEDAEIAEIFAQLGETMTRISLDGDKMRLENEVAIDYGEGNTVFTTSYVIIDEEVYMELSYSTDTSLKTVRNKAEITKEQSTALYNKISIIGAVSESDFSEKTENAGVTVCKSVTDDGKEKLEKVLLSQLEGAAEFVRLKSAELKIVTVDALHESVVLECSYDVTLGKKTYSVNMSVEMDYTYSGIDGITAPLDAEDYVYVTIDKILGLE